MNRTRKLLAVASGGGHWKQLMQLRENFTDLNVHYVTTIDGLPQKLDLDNFTIVRDSNKEEKLNLLVTFVQLLLLVIRFRPDFIITTGAAPGLLAILLGRFVGAKTMWIDSIANGEELSLGGRLATRFSHVVLTQWPTLAQGKVQFKGSVL